MRSFKPLAALLAATTVLCVGVAARVPVSAMPGYQLDIEEWIRTGRIADTFTPLAYPLFAGSAYRLGHNHGILAAQILLHLAMVLMAYLILRELRVSPLRSALGSLPIALSPDLLLAVTKVWDFALSTFVMLLLVLCFLKIANRRGFAGWGLTIASGAAFGFAMASRANLIILLPVAVVLFFVIGRSAAKSIVATGAAVFLVVAFSGFAMVGIASHGSVFIPRNGPYNLYAGHNPYTIEEMIQYENGEPSIRPAITPTYPGLSSDDMYAHSLEPFYMQQAEHFIVHNPGTEIKLLGVKLFTLLRPDTKVQPLHSGGGMAKAVLALPVPIFLAMLLLTGRRALLPVDWLLILIETLYVVPFLISNSDPRFRSPLDAVLLLHSVSLLDRYLKRRAPASVSAEA
jgi:hypothetical protein